MLSNTLMGLKGVFTLIIQIQLFVFIIFFDGKIRNAVLISGNYNYNWLLLLFFKIVKRFIS